MEENHVAIKVVRKVKRYTKSAKIEADILSNLNHIEHSSNVRAPKPFMYVIQLVDSFILIVTCVLSSKRVAQTLLFHEAKS